MKHLMWIIAASFWLTCFQVKALPIIDVVVFGDSLSDTGNLFIASGNPPPPYFEGRFSNGPIYAETFNNLLGIGPLVPALLGGNNFAWGGAMAAQDVPLSAGAIPGVTTQVGQYLSTLGTTAAAPNTLALIFIGNNDVAYAIEQGFSTATAMPFFNLGISQILQSISQLNLAGIDQFLVPLVPDWGITPEFMGNTNATELSNLFNLMLSSALSQNQNLDITVFDTNGLLLNHLGEFINTTDACLAQGCQSPNDYLFFDNFHPSAKAHQIFGGALRAVVPIPNTVALILLCLMIWISLLKWPICKRSPYDS